MRPRAANSTNPPPLTRLLVNAICNVCGWVLVSVIVIMLGFFVYFLSLSDIEKDLLNEKTIVFYLESVGVSAFAIAWMAKGRAGYFLLARIGGDAAT